MKRISMIARGVVLGVLLLLVACGEDAGGGSGNLTLSLDAEESITLGLDPGSELDDVQDGWSVRYRRVLLTVGDVVVQSSDDASELRARTRWLLDLTKLPAGGFPLLDEQDVDAVRYDQVSFANRAASESLELGPSVSSDDRDMMREHGWSIYVEGELEKADGQSCVPGDPDDCVPAERIRFAWGADAGTTYEHCGPEDGDLGLAVSAGGTTHHDFTIHGDHWFFNAFPQGAEIVERRAQWVADADLDRDGETTLDELRDTRASDAFPSSEYSLSGSPIPIQSAYDFLVAQSHTIGHFDGEGECEGVVR